jgi:hypothetical protein
VAPADHCVDQVDNWFHDQRKRLRKVISLGDKMLTQGANDEAVRGADDEGEDDMLLSQGTESAPSLTSRASINSSVLASAEQERSLKRPPPLNETVLPDKSSACDLGEAAIQVLTSGHTDRGLRGLSGVQIERSPPSLSLASLAPSIFCPGFKEVCIISSLVHPFSIAHGEMFRSQWHKMHTFSQQCLMPSPSLGLEMFNRQH